MSALTVSCDFKKLYQMTDRCFVGYAGLATDVMSLSESMRFRRNLYRLREEREMGTETVSHVLESALYAKRFAPWFVEPVVAGLDEKGGAFLSGMDLIGCPVYPRDFVVAGTSVEGMFGICESLWREGMNPEELFETISQCILASADRDALAGWGAVVHVISKDGVSSKRLKARMD